MSDGQKKEYASAIDRFLMQPADLRILDVVRRCYAVLLLLNVGLLWLDRSLFFGPGSWLPPESARAIIDPDTFDLYSIFPESPLTITLALAVLAAAGLAMLFSWFPRIAALVTFFLLICVQHANVMLFDGEDIVFRLFAFYLIFVPPRRDLEPRQTSEEISEGTCEASLPSYPVWPVRMFQLQFCLIYLCTAIQKSDGNEWLDGTAVYYALRLDDMTKFPLPAAITESLGWSKFLTWSTLAFEFAVPVLIWWRRTRWICIVAAVLFHLGLDYAMNLHLFHWIMMVGLLSFVRYDELQAVGRWVGSRFSGSGG